MTRTMTDTEISNAARALGLAMRRWKLISGAECLVFEFPIKDGEPSPAAGEDGKFWRFADKREAEGFRDRKIIESIAAAMVHNHVVEAAS